MSARAASSSSAASAEPLFIAYCPDAPTTATEGDTYARRLSVRAEHWARAQVDREEGRLCE
jgi:hypothetical protein